MRGTERGPDVNHLTAKLNAAEAITEYVLHGLLDKQGQPTVEHCQRVAKSCRSLTLDQRLAAILHDAVEDSCGRLTLEVVETLFGRPCRDIVDALTRRPMESYQAYIERVRHCPEAILVKLADLNDNLDESRGTSPEVQTLRPRYLKAKERLEIAVATGAIDR